MLNNKNFNASTTNWIGLWTLFSKETTRFLKVFYQTVLAPVVTNILFLTVFLIVIDRKDFEGEPKVLGKGLWDGVVDTVGGTILSNAISQTRHSGIVAACGNAANIKLNTTVMPFIIRGVKLWGIDSVMLSKKRREFIWSQVPNFIDFKLLEKNIKIVNLEELLNIFPDMLNGKISGRILVDLRK